MKRLVAAALILGWFTSVLVASPALAARRSACERFVPTKPITDDGGEPRRESLTAPLIQMGDKATRSKPITRTYQHGPGLSFPLHQGPEIVDDHKYFNFQVTTKRFRRLYIRVDWPTPSASDIDIYLYSDKAKLVAWSESFNNTALDTAFSPIFGPPTGGPGFEFMRLVNTVPCEGFMFDSEASTTLGETARLTAWLA
jgi:hypothetical protein